MDVTSEPGQQSWEKFSELDAPISYGSCTFVGDQLFIVGGKRADGSVLSSVIVIDAEGNIRSKWEMEVAVIQSALVPLSTSQILLFGGTSGPAHSQ
jgi:hypothetical protein